MLFDGELDDSVTFAVPKSSRRVHGQDISKATARKATDDERWRFGVEMRRLNSRWYTQTRAPHYPTPEPYVYRRQPVEPWRAGPKYLARMQGAYDEWLAARDAAPPAPPPEETPMPDNVTEFHPREVAAPPAPVPVDARREAAAELLREIAGAYGPRRAHKLLAMADWLVAPQNARPAAARPGSTETAA